MLDTVIINILFIISPILCYLIYIVYENAIGKKGDNLFFDFAIVSSMYLITKCSVYFNYDVNILKVLLLLCLLKNKKLLSIIVSSYIVLYYGVIVDCNIYLVFLEYFMQLSMFYILLKNKDLKIKLSTFCIIGIICNITIYNYQIIYSIIINICYTILGLTINEVISKGEKIINIYGTVRDIENEKSFRDSLFKITHEIKNPIAVCKGYLDMLDVNNSKQVNKYIPIIKQEIERTLTLMSDYLSLTKLKIEKTDVNMTLLLDDLCSGVEELLIENNIHFIFDVKDQDVYINGDYDRLKQVFVNIIKNSKESIEKNKIGLIKLKMYSKEKKVIITISDNGIGMNKETLKRVGEAFYTTKKGGTGLGVKLSKEIIELHNGTIKYSSKENVGTTVQIKLPIKK